jgi:hypothetical protein
MQNSLAAPTYSFTTPVPTSRATQRHAPAPGCALCTILVKLEGSRSVDPEEQTVTYSRNDDQPLSPAIASPAVAQNPLLPVNPVRSPERTTIDGRALVVDDDDLTGWLASPSERLANDGRHAVIVFKRHVEDVYAFVSLAPITRSISFGSFREASTIEPLRSLVRHYMLDIRLTYPACSLLHFPLLHYAIITQGPADIPLLAHALQTAHAILDRAPSGSRAGGKGKAKATTEQEDEQEDHRFDGCGEGSRRIGFLTGFPRELIRGDRLSAIHVFFPQSVIRRPSVPLRASTHSRNSWTPRRRFLVPPNSSTQRLESWLVESRGPYRGNKVSIAPEGDVR